MTRWLRCFWDEESIWFYLELDEGGFVVRQIELAGPSGAVLAAACLSEWEQAHAEGRGIEYERVYGLTAQAPICEWEGHDPRWLSVDEFEQVWSATRARVRGDAFRRSWS